MTDLSRDRQIVLERTAGLWEPLRDQRIFITGGTGFFGKWLLQSFLWANEEFKLRSQLVVLSRNWPAFCGQMPRLAADPAISSCAGDVRDFAFPPGRFSHVIHAATDSSAKLNEENPLLMLDTIVQGTRHTLDFARHCEAEKFLLTSSGAVYGEQPPDLANVGEDYLGAPDTMAPRSAYGQGKRIAEHLCVLYGQQYQFEAKIARSFAFVGPHLPLDIHFAIGNFIRDGLRGGPIVVQGDGTPCRSYLYAADLAIWLWAILLCGAAGRPYNVGSEEAISIAELAHVVADGFRPRPEVRIVGSPTPGKPAKRYVPSTGRAQSELNLRETVDLRQAIERSIEYYRQLEGRRPEDFMIKLSDYIVKRLADYGVRHVFMVTGGGAMHLNDSLGKEPRIQYICNHHEQACAMAAEGYARISGTIGAVCVTTGPGGTNALTGVLGQWLDSIPAIYISGQVRTETTIAHSGLPVRQIGDQEADIIPIVRPVTKYATSVTDPSSVRYHLEKALYLARSGRPGPVWLDFPLDVQAAMVDEDALPAYDPAEDRLDFDRQQVEAMAAEILRRLGDAQRPVIIAGAGIRLAGAYDVFQAVLAKLGVPVLAAWDAIDVIPSEHPCYFGRPGTLGQRGANFIFQNADLLLSIGCRLNVRQIGYLFASVGRAAMKIVVDVDPLELKKPTIHPDLPVHCDAKLLLECMERQLGERPLPAKPEWISWCKARYDRYPVVLPEYWESADFVNPYVFCQVLSDCLAPDDVVVSSNGMACVMPIQTLRIQPQQRHVVNSGCAAMGFGLPAAIGACFARGKRRTVCLEGDGSLQLNIQELQTVAHHQLPTKIFVFDNDGYLSIRSTQTNFFAGHMVGESERSGVSFPDFVRVAEAYGIPATRVDRHAGLEAAIRSVLDAPGPALCDVRMCPDQWPAPRAASQRLPDGTMVSKPLEDMYPFLDREELLSNMLIPLWKPPR